MAGLHIANSEVGKRSVTVDALVYRLVCTNGLIRLVKGKSLLHRRHVAFYSGTVRGHASKFHSSSAYGGRGFMERMKQAPPNLWGCGENTRSSYRTVESFGEVSRRSQRRFFRSDGASKKRSTVW